MIYRFVIVSSEERSFRRDIRIGSGATFAHLRDALYEEIGFSIVEPSLFHLTDRSWAKQLTIYETEPSFSRSDIDIYLQHNTRLSELLTEERERLLLEYDPERSRAFYMELREITSGDLARSYEISRREGEAPHQRLPEEVTPPKKEEKKEAKKTTPLAAEPDEKSPKRKKQLNEEATPDEYGSEDFDTSEIDLESFGTSDESGEFDNEIPTEDFSL